MNPRRNLFIIYRLFFILYRIFGTAGMGAGARIRQYVLKNVSIHTFKDEKM